MSNGGHLWRGTKRVTIALNEYEFSLVVLGLSSLREHGTPDGNRPDPERLRAFGERLEAVDAEHRAG